MDTPEANNIKPSAPAGGNTIVLRIPKINFQAGLLGLVALITVFQTVQLFRINGRANVASVKASTVNSNPSPSHGSGVNTAAPQSMVGGC